MQYLRIWSVVGLALLAGCGVSNFTAKTRASWTEPGGKSIMYESDKDNIGLDATFDPKTGFFHIKVDKASTPEAAIAAAQASQAQMLQSMSKMMDTISPIVTKGMAGGGSAVPVVPPIAPSTAKPSTTIP